MGFDQGSTKPLVQPEKKTTKVNIFLILAVVIFFGVAAYLVRQTTQHKPQSSDDVTKPSTLPAK